tara:strand:+ start:340 stop:594 length:255 start_codon:yes stop_codon:yes gene_type:complete
MSLVKVKEHSNLIKDSRTGQIIDTDENAYQRYLAGKKARQDAKEKQLNNEVDLKSVKGDLDQLKSEITEIKTLLNELVSKWHIF